MNLIEDTQLMKQSKADLVAALVEVGVTQVSADTPLSEIAELMKWAGGLRDVTLACVSKADGSQAFFTRTQWDALSVTAKGSYIRIGVRVRAERTQFIVAKADALSETGTTSMAWQPSSSSYTDVPGLTNFVANPAMFRDLDGEANTDKILAWAAESGISHPAAKQARAYKAATVADGGYNDPTKWSLAAVGQMLIMYKYLLEINAELEYFFGTSARIAIDWYWSSTEYSSSVAWNFTMHNGFVYHYYKPTAYRVRPVSRVAESAI